MVTKPKVANVIENKANTAKATGQPIVPKVIPNQPTVTTAKKAPVASATRTRSPSTVRTKPTPASKTNTSATKVVSKPVAAEPTANNVTTKLIAAVKAPVKELDKKHKPEKVKMERDSFTMPKEEYAHIHTLKTRMIGLGHPVKKSELLRAGIMLLAQMDDASLKAAIEKIPVIKTGRPKK